MIATERSDTPALAADAASLTAGLPSTATVLRRWLAAGDSLEILVVPTPLPDDPTSAAAHQGPDGMTERLRAWVMAGNGAAPAPAGAAHPLSPPAVVVPLYGSLVVWTPGRAALAGAAEALGQLEEAVLEFANREAELRAAEGRAAALLDALPGDAARGFTLDGEPADPADAPAERYREAVALGRALALLAPAVHAPPLHPPTLASQLGERLRDRTRLVERHGLAVERAEFIERTTEARAHRALEVGVARRQTGLEWAIVVLLVVQTVLLVIDLLARRGTP
jgi:hypothetical protein